MKRTTLTIILALASLCASGQTVSYAQRLLSGAVSALEAMDSYRVPFTYKTDGEASARKCTLYAMGDKFRLESELFTMFSDGVYSYTVSDDEKEVSVRRLSDTGSGIVFGPVQDMLKRFSAAFTPRTDRLDGKVQYLRLVPKSKDNPSQYVLVGVDTTTKLPVSVEEVSHGGARTRLEIAPFVRGGGKESSLYAFDEQKYKKMGYYIARP